MAGWYGYDLDGTLAYYERGQSKRGIRIGKPVARMVQKVQNRLARGEECRIVTARASVKDPAERNELIAEVEQWCLQHIGQILPVTAQKDFEMIALYDDRAVGIVPNTGIRADGKLTDEE